MNCYWKSLTRPSRLKGSILLLTFLFSNFAFPVSVVFAEEEVDISEEAVIEETTDEIRDVTDQDMEESPEELAPEQMESLLSEDDEAIYDASQLTPDVKPEIDKFSGALSYSYKLTVPPGRNNFDPELSLKYSSQDNTIGNVAGYGWSTDIPYIQRTNKKGVDNLYSTTSSSTFMSSLQGDLATTSTNNVYYAEADNGEFLSYTYASNTWTVTDKDGKIYKYGSATSTRQDDPNNTSNVYKWMLDEVTDTNGNFIRYTYTKDGGQIYPSEIKYTGNGVDEGIFKIQFATETRSDISTSTATGFEVVTKYRIESVTALINNVPAKKYELNYGVGDNGYRSLLNNIVEMGWDDNSATTTMPAVQFDYQSPDPGWTLDESYELPGAFMQDGSNLDLRTEVMDPDGLLDFTHSKFTGGSPSIGTYINMNDGTFDPNSAWNSPVYYSYNGDSRFVQILDFNGDALSDITYGLWLGYTDKGAYLNTGTGFSSSTSNWFTPVIFGDSDKDNGARFADVNGDNLPDILYGEYDSVNNVLVRATYLNTGNGFATSTKWLVPEQLVSNSGRDIGVRLIDVNGDGLADILRDHYSIVASTTYTYVYLNDGVGNFATSSNSWVIPQRIIYGTYDHGVRFADANGDGLVDILYSKYDPGTSSSYQGVYLNTGSGWDLDTDYSLPTAFVNYGSVDNGVRIGDIDADGMIDILHAEINGGSDIRNAYINNGPVGDLLYKITFPTGGSVEVTYKSSSTYSDDSGDRLNPDLPLPLQTVSNITYKDDGYGGNYDLDYSYEGGKYFYENAEHRRFAGFNKLTEIDGDGNKTITYFHQGTTTDSSNGEYDDHYSKIGKVYRIEKYDNYDNLYDVIIYKWNRSDRGGRANFVKLDDQVELTYDGDSDHKDKAVSYVYSDVFGNLSQLTEWGEVSGSTDGTFSDTGTDKLTTSYSYATSSTSTVKSLLSQETTLDYASSTVRETKYYYDNASHGAISKGNLTKKELLKSGSSYIDTEWTYNSYGLVTQEKDPRDKATNYIYDSANLYVASSTNPLSQTTSFLYDYSLGKPKKIWDPNGVASEIVYDGVDRVVTEKISNIASPSSLVTKTTYDYDLTSAHISVHKTDYLNGATSTNTYIYLDGIGRKLQERKSAEGSGQYVINKFEYNSRGLLARESLPVFTTGSSYASTSISSNLFTDYTYDPMGRVTVVSNVVGNTTNTYDDWDLTVTDALSNDKEYRNDAFGNLTRVREHNATSTYTTSYEWNGNKNLTKITDADGNVRNFTYDKLGRRLTAEDLHDVGDGTFGTWTYVYDDAGNTTQIVDPKSQTINRTYDDVNRLLTEDYTGTGGTEVTYTYDSCTYGIGRLCTVNNSTASSTYQYTSVGQVDTEARTIASTTYTTNYDYDRQGNITNILYPDNSEVRYTFNAGGLIESVAQKESGGSFTDIITNLDYAPTGRITLKEFANGVTTEYTYDANELYRLRNIYTIRNSEELGFIGSGEGEFAVLTSKVALLKVSTNDLDDLFASEYVLPDYSLALSELAPINTEEIAPSEPEVDTSEESVIPEVVETPVDEEPVVSDTASTDIETEDTSESLVPVIEFKVSTSTISEIKEIVAEEEVATATEKIGSSTEGFARLTLLAEDAPELKLKAAPKDILGEEMVSDNIVKYAYKTDTLVDDVPVGEVTQQKASEAGLEISEEDISKRTKYSRTFATDQENVFVTEIVSDLPQYYEDENGEWWIADYAVTTETAYTEQKAAILEVENEAEGLLDTIFNMAKSVIAFISDMLGIHTNTAYATTGTFYPDPNTETTSVDGYIGATGFSTWSGARNSTTGTADDSSATISIMDEFTSSSKYNIRRGFFLFDTSSIPDNATIATATIDMYVLGIAAGGSEQRFYLASSTPSSNTALVSGDFDNIGSASYGVTDGTMTGNSHEILTLNATGTAQISKTSVSKFAIRTHNDLNNITTSNSLELSIDMSGAETSGTSQDPKLVVIYSIAPTAPTSLLTEGLTNPTNIVDTTPEFSALYNDSDTGEYATHYQLQVSTSSAFATTKWDSAKTILSSSTIAGTRIPDISYSGTTLATSTTYYWRIKFWDEIGIEGAWSSATSTFSILGWYPPEIPTSLQTEGLVNPTNVTDITPDFTAIFNDNDTATGTHYQIEIATSSGFTNIFWDSTKTILSSAVATGTRSVEMPYTGTTSLAFDTTYYWRVKFWDTTDLASEWSTSTATFMLDSAGDVLQNITFTYDAVGNITNIEDNSDTLLAKEVDYTYDDLYRLTSASTTVASHSPYHETYSYSSIGNMTSKSDLGSYTYGETGYANPHAVTAIGSTTLTYDNNGNALTSGTSTYAWDYLNRMTASNEGSATTTYGYDQSGHRVSKTTGATTTRYTNQFYNTNGTTKTKHIYAGGELIATVETIGSTSTTQYLHGDHLGGTNVVTDTEAEVSELTDYYPYGAIRVNDGSFNEQRKFTGHVYDEETSLNYMGARYQNGSVGRFISQDPVFLSVGDEQKIKEKTKLSLEKYLSDPQGLNSYSYARNNPMRLVDENGEWFKEVLTGQQSLSDFQVEVGQATQQMTQDSKAWNYAVNNPGKAGAVVGLAGGATALTAVPAVAAFSSAVVNVSGVGPVLVTNRLIEGSIYTYLASESLGNLPDNLVSASQLKQGDLKSYGTFIGKYALDYGPNFAGETVDAVSSVAQFSKSIVDKITNLVQKQQKKDNKSK